MADPTSKPAAPAAKPKFVTTVTTADVKSEDLKQASKLHPKTLAEQEAGRAALAQYSK